ncbi:unannotated protein [freshwater metagenome]|uniref:Unannotated protein n=1 Tax=freshwater metagenome TaxID=449393 RepID=A0A6J7TG03_9ZZZZ
MRLSVPSFLAALIRFPIPPKLAADVAFDALTPAVAGITASAVDAKTIPAAAEITLSFLDTYVPFFIYCKG